jgi:hypothetical protein
MLARRGVGRVGRPGLIGTAARTAVVAGTATAVSGGMQRRRQQGAAPAEAAQAPPHAPPPPEYDGGDDRDVVQLERLAEMRSQGLLTNEEFAAAKSKLLGT